MILLLLAAILIGLGCIALYFNAVIFGYFFIGIPVLFVVILIVFAWIINPIRSLLKKK